MGCGLCCSKAVLITVNIISLILGLGLLTLGCILKFGQSIVEQMLGGLLPKEANFNMDFLFGSVAIALIVIGVVVFLLSLFGCCGACCDSRCMLVVYVAVVVTILVAELVCVILVVAMKDQMDTFLQSQLNDTIVNNYAGYKSMDTVSLAWNIIQLQLNCCGVLNYTDYQMAKNWSRSIMVNAGGTPTRITMQLPVTCCKMDTTLDKVDPDTLLNCLQTPTVANANIEKGCYQAVEEVIGNQSGITIGVTCAILVCQLILVILACCVCCSKKDTDDDLNKVYPNYPT